MKLRDFANTTINVITEDGIEGYLPTFVLVDTLEIRAIQGIPTDVDHRDAIQNIIRRSGYETREFFFAVQSAPEQITIGHCQPNKSTMFMVINETTKGYMASKIASCNWWRGA